MLKRVEWTTEAARPLPRDLATVATELLPEHATAVDMGTDTITNTKVRHLVVTIDSTADASGGIHLWVDDRGLIVRYRPVARDSKPSPVSEENEVFYGVKLALRTPNPENVMPKADYDAISELGFLDPGDHKESVIRSGIPVTTKVLGWINDRELAKLPDSRLPADLTPALRGRIDAARATYPDARN